MLDFPRVVVTELIAQFELRERILQKIEFRMRGPRPRELTFVEDAEFHRKSSLRVDPRSPDSSQHRDCG